MRHTMKKVALAVLLAVTIAVPAMAQSTSGTIAAGATVSIPVVSQAKAPDLFKISDGGPVTVIQPAAQPTATIDTGGLAGQALLWVMATFGTTIGTIVTAWLYKLMQAAGVRATDAMRAKLQDIIVNGLNLGAKQAAEDLQGHGKVEIKNAAVATAVVYAQQHGADTLKQLGLDPTSPEAVEAIKARIETAIVDPATPTAPVLDAPGQPKQPAPAPIPVADAKLEAVAAKA